MVLGRVFTGKWPHLASAYITGISVGILVRSPAFWPYALCGALSITSKYVLRVKNRHIFNPSNFGICVMLFLAYYAVASLSIQWGNYLWPMAVIWALGCAIIYRLKRFHITATYVVSFLALSLVRSLITGHTFWAEVAPLTGPMYQLYVFFMITDPKTTVSTRRGRMIVAFLVALVEMLLRLNQVVHAPYYALFLVGPSALLFDMWWRSRQASPAELSVQERGA
jgi:Na+-transporting NADH:ubiquinone oxidoreductase subunit NqrB